MTEEVGASIGPESGLGVAIVLHRGSTTLPPQDARLVRPGGQSRGRTQTGTGTESEEANISVVGWPWLDIRPRDRFALDGNAYEVLSVQPQRQIETVALVRLVQ